MIIYLIMFIFTIVFRKNEIILLTGLTTLLGIAIYLLHYNIEKTIILLIFGFILTFASYISIKYFKIMEFHNTKYLSIPLWLLPAWCLVGIFYIDFSKNYHKILWL